MLDGLRQPSPAALLSSCHCTSLLLFLRSSPILSHTRSPASPRSMSRCHRCPPWEMEEAPRHDPLGASLLSDERLARYSRLSERDTIVRVLCRHYRQTRYSVV